MINRDDETPPEELDKLIDSIARDIVRRRLETGAVLFLESHKPLTFMTSQAMIVGTPLLGAFIGVDRMSRYSNLLSSVDNVERLIRRIEDLTAERDSQTADVETDKDTRKEL